MKKKQSTICQLAAVCLMLVSSFNFVPKANAAISSYGALDTAIIGSEAPKIVNGSTYAYGNFNCTVTATQVGNGIKATANVVGDLTDFNRLGWKLEHSGTADQDTSETINLSTAYPKDFSFGTVVADNTLYKITATFYSVIIVGEDGPRRSGIACETNFTTNPETPDQVPILGKVTRTQGSGLESCPLGRFYYGDNCGNSTCYGSPNYTVSWRQGTYWFGSLSNNSCFDNSPRYTFEDETTKPLGSTLGENTTITINAESNLRLTHWIVNTTDSNGNPLAGSIKADYFSEPGPNQTFTVPIYKDGGYIWNHLWFFLLDNRKQSECTISIPDAIKNGFVYTGENFSANPTVQMKNMGTTTWTTSGNYNLGSREPQDNTRWGFNRVSLTNASLQTVGPNQTTTFTISGAKAPTTEAGNLFFNWQMIQEGVSWFGQTCSSLIKVVNPPSASITGPTTGTVGTSLTYAVTANANAGSPTNNVTRGMVLVAKQDQSVVENRTPTNWGCADNTYAPWCLVTDNTSNPTSFNSSWTPSPSQTGTYYIAVNAYNYDGGMCSGNPFGISGLFRYCDRTNTPHVNDYKTVTVSVNPPTIQSLQVGQKPGTQSTISGGKWKMSGRQTSEQGSDWLNPITVKLNVTPGAGAPSTEYYTAFYTGAQLTNKNTFLSDVQAKVNNPANGFLLGEFSGKQWVWNPQKNSCAGGWENLTDDYPAPDGFSIYSCGSTTRYYRAEPTSNPRQWNIYFYKDVPSQTFNTAGYATTNMDVSVSDLKGEMQPSPIP